MSVERKFWVEELHLFLTFLPLNSRQPCTQLSSSLYLHSSPVRQGWENQRGWPKVIWQAPSSTNHYTTLAGMNHSFSVIIRIILKPQSWKEPYGSSSSAAIKEAQHELELPTSGSATRWLTARAFMPLYL